MHNRRSLLRMAAITVAAALPIVAQKKTYQLKGKVESVDMTNKVVVINHEEIKGLMAAMTMPYSVDKEEILHQAKPGDQITGTLYDGDYTLHEVKLTPAPAKK